ncbi:MAG: winged helix-turn-helix transcriptional regulator [Gammaproteobacteria bacterium]
MQRKNATSVPERCYVVYCANKIRGKWKILIMHQTLAGANRFGELLRQLSGISRQALTKELRELETNGFLKRKVYAEVPPRVEYTPTPLGVSLLPVLRVMGKWGKTQIGD